jgi:hypothetical protein
MASQAPLIYCLDTSAFITMHRYYSYELVPPLWEDLLPQLFIQDRAFSHQLVLQEIEPTDYLGHWVSDKASRFFPVTQRQTQLVTKILARVPGLIDHEKEIDEADPWVVALAIEKIESSTLLQDFSRVTIVSTESKRSPKRIPAVCDAFSVPHMDLKQFFDANGWKLRIEAAK